METRRDPKRSQKRCAEESVDKKILCLFGRLNLPESQPWPFATVDERKAKLYHTRMDEGRKRVIGIMAAILAARKLAPYDAGKRVPATMSAISDAVRWAEEILKEIDRRWPG